MESLLQTEAGGNHRPQPSLPTNRLQAPEPSPNPFSPENLRLPQDFATGLGVKKVPNPVCRKPNRQEFVRVRPGVEWRLETGVYEDKVNREVYLVRPDLWHELPGEVFSVCLFVAMNRQSDLILWPCKLPGPDGRSNRWNESALDAARHAECKWVRLAANMTAGQYDRYEALGELPEPEWPDLSLTEILESCFRGRFINSPDHPVIRALRGLA
jgi:hypothetical protein